MQSSATLFNERVNYKELVERDLTENAELNGMTYEQFYKKYQTLLLLSKSYKSCQPIKENIEFYDDFTPLIIAIDRGLEKMAFKLLEQKNSDVNYQGPRDINALHCAAKKGNLPLVKKLIEKGARCNDRNAYGNAGMQFAAMSGNPDMVEFMISQVDKSELTRPTDYTNLALHFACQTGNYPSIRMIAESMDHTLIGKTGVNGCLPIFLAAKAGCLDGVKLLLDMMGQAEALVSKMSYSRTQNLLLASAESGNVDLYKYLRQQGASYHNSYGSFSYSLLKEAIKSDNPNMVKHVLADDRRDIVEYFNTEKNCEGLPLHFAIENGNLEIVKILIAAGANLEVSRSRDHCPPLRLARDLHRQDIADYLVQKIREENGNTNFSEIKEKPTVQIDSFSEREECEPDEANPIDPDKHYNPLASVCCIM